MRRVAARAPLRAASVAAPLAALQPVTAQRHFQNWWDVPCSLVTMALITGLGSAVGNNTFNMLRHGGWRQRHQFDDPIIHQDSKVARMIGAFLGFSFYWNWAGPSKYRRWMDLEYRWSNIRVGPF
jgi:hypothetical protein